MGADIYLGARYATPKKEMRRQVKAKDVELKYISTHDQVADILTKSLGERQHTKLRSALTGF